jgi:hypothetical protein
VVSPRASGVTIGYHKLSMGTPSTDVQTERDQVT